MYIKSLIAILLLSALNCFIAKRSSTAKAVVKVTDEEQAVVTKTFSSSSFVLNLIRKVDSKLIVAVMASTLSYNFALFKAGKELQFRPLTKLARLLLNFIPASRTTIFPSILQPPELKGGQAHDELVYTTGTSSLGIIYFSLISKRALSRILGKPKRLVNGVVDYDAFNELFNRFIKDDSFNRIGNEFLPKDYNYFGIYDGVGTLEAFMKYNPYFGATMIALSTMGLLTGFIVDPYADNTLFSSLVADLTTDVPRVVVYLDTKLRVTEMKVFVGKTLETRQDVSHIYSTDDKAYMALYQMIFFGQSIHASTHVSYEGTVSILL